VRKLILVVDDEADITLILRRILSKKGYTVKEDQSGEECLEILDKARPDLIFMDIMMPGLDGWETTRRLKQNPKTRDIPISMLSVKSEPEDLARSREYALADEHLKKPVDFDIILDTAQNLIQNPL
jgi:CheY-like chemotaxis protein